MSKRDTHSIEALVLDTISFILFSKSLIMHKASNFYTVPSVITEIKDEKSRQELSLWRDIITVRTPQSSSIQEIIMFSKKTGDYDVLSPTDIHILALTYELECEMNGGAQHLRKEPGKPEVNKSSLKKRNFAPKNKKKEVSDVSLPQKFQENLQENLQNNVTDEICQVIKNAENMTLKDIDDKDIDNEDIDNEDADDEDNSEWITPSNIYYYKSLNERTNMIPEKTETQIKVACVTNDFAIQNVLLQMDLNLVSPETGLRIKTVKSWVLRCYGCYKIIKDMSKKFCPGCGGNTLLRTSCSIDSNGKFQIYLKRHMQWNNRGTIYPIPKPRHGSASGKGYKKLIFNEDQKEYQKAIKYQERKKEIDLLDPDYIPDILTGKRNTSRYNVVIGMGKRNPNERVRLR
ncbi:hypothetical protein PCANB_002481 [Pneumocystis canis]|nr:hypothetical protein PCANB_002481 [Pneumocystis canis]